MHTWPRRLFCVPGLPFPSPSPSPTPAPLPPLLPVRFVPPPTFMSLSAAEKKAKFTKTWNVYIQGFRNEFAPVEESEEEKEAWKKTVLEQSSAARNVYDEAQHSPATAKAYFAEWIAIYRETLKGFTKGYNDGQAGIPLPADYQMKVNTPFNAAKTAPTEAAGRAAAAGDVAPAGEPAPTQTHAQTQMQTQTRGASHTSDVVQSKSAEGNEATEAKSTALENGSKGT